MALGRFARSCFKRKDKCKSKGNEFDKNADNDKGLKGNGKGNGKGKGKLMSPLDIFVLMEHLDRRDRGPPSDSESE